MKIQLWPLNIALVMLAALISTSARANTLGFDAPLGKVVIDSLTGNKDFVQITAHFDWTGTLTFGAGATGVFGTSYPASLAVGRSIGGTDVFFQPQWPFWPSPVWQNSLTFFTPGGLTYSLTGTDAFGFEPSFEVMDAAGVLWLVNHTVELNVTIDGFSGSGNVSILETRVNLPERASTAGLLLLGIGGLVCGRRACLG